MATDDTSRPRPATDVTRADAELLWSRALDDVASWPAVHESAEALLERVSSENPVVNWGLTSLHSLTRGERGNEDLDDLSTAHESWTHELRRYDADPATWMTRYFEAMVKGFADRYGVERGRSFAAKLVTQLVASGDLARTDAGRVLDAAG